MGQCTAPCKMLAFRARTIIRDPDNIELVYLKKKEKEEGKCFGHFTALYFGNAFWCHQESCWVCKDESYAVIKAYKFTAFERLF